MSSRSMSSANIAGVHLKQSRRVSSPSITKILPPTLKHSFSPHCNFSVALGKARQKARMESTSMIWDERVSPLQKIHRLFHIVDAEIFPKRGILACHRFIHRVGNTAIGNMPCRPCAKLSNISDLREVHFEQRALAIAKWHRILRVLGGLIPRTACELFDHSRGLLHRRFVSLTGPRSFEFGRNVVAVLCCETLADLHTATVAMHISEPANIHENVEAELLSCAKCAQHLVVLSPVRKP